LNESHQNLITDENQLNDLLELNKENNFKNDLLENFNNGMNIKEETLQHTRINEKINGEFFIKFLIKNFNIIEKLIYLNRKFRFRQ